MRSTAQESESVAERHQVKTREESLPQGELTELDPINYGVRLLAEDVVIPWPFNSPCPGLLKDEVFTSAGDLGRVMDLLRGMEPRFSS